MNFPGTFPPKVQKVYSTPSAIGRLTSLTSSSTTTLLGCRRVIRGGTIGASVRTAETGAPADFAADEPLLAFARCGCVPAAWAVITADVMISANTTVHRGRLNERFLGFAPVRTIPPLIISFIGTPPCRDVYRDGPSTVRSA